MVKLTNFFHKTVKTNRTYNKRAHVAGGLDVTGPSPPPLKGSKGQLGKQETPGWTSHHSRLSTASGSPKISRQQVSFKGLGFVFPLKVLKLQLLFCAGLKWSKIASCNASQSQISQIWPNKSC